MSIFECIGVLIEFMEYAHDERILEEIKKASNLVITSVKEKRPNIKKLKK